MHSIMSPIWIALIFIGSLALRGCSSQVEESPELQDIERMDEEIRTGIGENGIRPEIGQLILLRRDGADVALKLVEQTRPSQHDFGMLGAKYECFVYDDDDHHRYKKYTGEVYEPDGQGRHDHVYIDCGTFTIRWSAGDWIYFDDSVLSMARTGKTDVEEIDFDDLWLDWYYRPPTREAIDIFGQR